MFPAKLWKEVMSADQSEVPPSPVYDPAKGIMIVDENVFASSLGQEIRVATYDSIQPLAAAVLSAEHGDLTLISHLGPILGANTILAEGVMEYFSPSAPLPNPPRDR
jgi:hypothetical protein